jgi:hypothetical protein
MMVRARPASVERAAGVIEKSTGLECGDVSQPFERDFARTHFKLVRLTTFAAASGWTAFGRPIARKRATRRKMLPGETDLRFNTRASLNPFESFGGRIMHPLRPRSLAENLPYLALCGAARAGHVRFS